MLEELALAECEHIGSRLVAILVHVEVFERIWELNMGVFKLVQSTDCVHES